MKIFTFLLPSSSVVGDDVQHAPDTAHIIAKDITDAIAVASEKNLGSYVQVTEGPAVFAVAGMFE